MQEVMSPSICEVNSFFMMYFNHLCVWKGKNKVYIFALRVQKKKIICMQYVYPEISPWSAANDGHTDGITYLQRFLEIIICSLQLKH